MGRILGRSELEQLARKWGAEFKVDPALLVAVALVESGGDSLAVGDGGDSLGLMQLHARGARATWAANGHAPVDWFDPSENMRVAAWFLGKSIPVQLRQLGESLTVRNAVVAYNAGASRVKRPDHELPTVTQHYLRKVRESGVYLGGSLRGIEWPKAAVVVTAGMALLSLLRSVGIIQRVPWAP